MTPTKPFEVVQIDLAGPLKVMKQRARLKRHAPESVWVLVVTCQFSRAVFLDALESYSTDSLEKHYANSTEFQWEVVPTTAHHYFGGAEKMMGMMKKLMRKLDGAALSHNELLLFLLEVAKMLNTRRLVAETSEDGERWRMIA
ncbi:MAG: hypothetical protein GY696_20400 [Gammaproteobacteria bacterium]|nr:hypothetical protein [Gammaproteobacteria bacterium]